MTKPPRLRLVPALRPRRLRQQGRPAGDAGCAARASRGAIRSPDSDAAPATGTPPHAFEPADGRQLPSPRCMARATTCVDTRPRATRLAASFRNGHRIADRHRGVGCEPMPRPSERRASAAVASYRIWNADGSVAGNAATARVASQPGWYARARRQRQGAFAIGSPPATGARDEAGGFVIDMASRTSPPMALPMRGWSGAAGRLRSGRRRLRFGAVSMGNPRAVVRPPTWRMRRWIASKGPARAHRAFPESVNVGRRSRGGRPPAPARHERAPSGLRRGIYAAVAVLVRRGPVASHAPVRRPTRPLRIDGPPAAAAWARCRWATRTMSGLEAGRCRIRPADASGPQVAGLHAFLQQFPTPCGPANRSRHRWVCVKAVRPPTFAAAELFVRTWRGGETPGQRLDSGAASRRRRCRIASFHRRRG